MSVTAFQFMEAGFDSLLRASWQASVLTLVVVVIQLVLGERLNPRWRHALWLLVIARLVVPFQPECSLSLFWFTPREAPEVTSVVMPSVLFAGNAAGVTAIEPVATSKTEEAQPHYSIPLFPMVMLAWLIGSLTLLGLTLKLNWYLWRQTTATSTMVDPYLTELLNAAKRDLNIQRKIRLIESAHIQSPAIMGLFQPVLLLPLGARERFNAVELRFIFLHELAHLKRGDVVLQALIALLHILHWFNPVLWFAFRRIRIDREPATDALVLLCTGEGKKQEYGLTLIKLLEEFSERHSLPTLVCVLEDRDQFKNRFKLISRFSKAAYGWSFLGIMIFVILAIAGLTKQEAALAVTQQSQPSADVPAGLVKVKLQVVELGEGDYQAHHDEIEIALKHGDVLPLARLRSFNLVTEPSCTILPGNDATLSATREFSFPTNFARDSHGVFVPTEFKKRSVGVVIPVVPEIADGKITLKGNLLITSFEGFVKLSEAKLLPSFDVREVYFFEELKSGQPTAIEAPGTQMEVEDPTAIAKSIPGGPQKLQRLFLFISADYKPDPKAIIPRITPVPKPDRDSVEIELKIAEIADSAYEANKEKIDAAVDGNPQGLISLLNNLQGVSLLSAPTVTTQFGQRAQVDIVQGYPDPISMKAGPDGKLVPDASASKEEGIKFDITPALIDNKIVLNGKLSITSFAGLLKGNLGYNLPSFSTNEANFSESLMDGQSKAFWLPGIGNISGTHSITGQNSSPNKLLFWVMAKRVH